MQPEEFRQFHQRALEASSVPSARDETDANGGGGGDATSTVGTAAVSTAASTGPSAKAEEQEREQRIAAVYDMFVNAKVMRR